MEVKEANSLGSPTRAQLDQFVYKCQLKTGSKPQYVIIAPGRVNLIGDHIDYHGFSVLPMAIKQATWLGCCFTLHSSTDPKLSLINADEDRYPTWTGDHSFGYGAKLDSFHAWQHYVLCGFHGLLATDLLALEADQVHQHAKTLTENSNNLKDANKLLANLPDITLFIDSDLPAASGLSSSSALVCGSSLATALLLQHQRSFENSHSPPLPICPILLANKCSKFEHLIGTQGGGMDQAIIMNAKEHYSKYIAFKPSFNFQDVRLPSHTEWLVAHCGHSYPKAATSGFNARVLESKLAAAIIVKTRQASGIKLDSSITIWEVRYQLFDGHTDNMLQYLRNTVFKNKVHFSVDEICQYLELPESELNKNFNTSSQFTRIQLENQLNLLDRCEHVLEEAERVELFKSICDTTGDAVQLGHLMTQSHYSLRDKYNCSHPSLDKLVEVALGAGALGSRLTGAGWGGCTVTLVESSKSDHVLAKLREVSKFCFKTSPHTGCQIVKV